MKIKPRNISGKKKKKKKKQKKAKNLTFEFISTGNLLLNLVLSGFGKNGGFARGRIANIIGDGSTGKTLLVLEVAAWCYYNLRKVASKIFGKVKKVIIVFNNVEGVMDFPLEKMFKSEFAEAIIWERISIVENIAKSLTKRVKNLKKGEALIYIIDSWDGVKSREEAENWDKSMAAREGTKEKSDGYGVSKQAYTHKFFRNITDEIYGKDYTTAYDYKLDQKDVTILITSQIRPKINATPFEKDTYRTGGKAFDFWTHACLWLYNAGRLSHERKGKRVTYGIKVRAVCERNKVTAPWKECRFPIIHSDNHGIDNVGAMVDYTFGPQKKKYSWKRTEIGTKEKFIEYIQDNDLEDELMEMTMQEWINVEAAAAVKRKPKYR